VSPKGRGARQAAAPVNQARDARTTLKPESRHWLPEIKPGCQNGLARLAVLLCLQLGLYGKQRGSLSINTPRQPWTEEGRKREEEVMKERRWMDAVSSIQPSSLEIPLLLCLKNDTTLMIQWYI
jgi:hypothetical protein